MTGQQLKEKVQQAKIPFNVLAERLGITAQSLNSNFKVKDVRSNTIERIADALNVDMSFFYPSDKGQTVASGDGSVAVSGNNNVAGNVVTNDALLQEKVKYLKQQVEDKERLLAEKERLIKVLMEKK